jgi:signal transduction histidine kinase
MKTEFIGLVSHQLRTPLASLRWYLEMLLSQDAGPISKEQLLYVEEAMLSSTRMLQLVNALLNASRLELGKMELHTERIELPKFLENIVRALQLNLARKKLSVEIVVDPGADTAVQSDQNLLQLIVENFLTNAIRYGTEGTKVTARVSEDKEKKTRTISVTNLGIGIPPEQVQYIGKKLFRATNAKLAETDGNGLGLYLSNAAAERIAAKLSFVSEEGKGATFSVTVPEVFMEEKAKSVENG